MKTGFLAILPVAALLSACPSSLDLPASRPFSMGFTPWPYQATQEAVDGTYAFINREGDLIAHHFQQGIPFTASDPGDPASWDQSIRDEIDGRIAATAAGKELYLALDCLNGARDGLADLWAEEGNLARPAPWDARGFDSPEVIAAYSDFALALIARFESGYGTEPRWFNYAPEISELMLNDPAEFDAFVGFAEAVYGNLKAAHPELRLMVSIALKDPGSAQMLAAEEGFSRIADWVDVAGVSAYPYAFFSHADKGDPSKLPAAWLSQIGDIAPGKPVFIAETGWSAQDISIPAYGLEVDGSNARQEAYLVRLLDEAASLGAEGIVWFAWRDYDRLWADTLGSDDLSRIWRDTGLVDQDGRKRPALSVWRGWMGLPRNSN